MGRDVSSDGITVEEAWQRLAEGDVAGHNAALSTAIRARLARGRFGCALLAQLSMAILLFDHPDPAAAFGTPVFTSAHSGFRRVRRLLAARAIEG